MSRKRKNHLSLINTYVHEQSQNSTNVDVGEIDLSEKWRQIEDNSLQDAKNAIRSDTDAALSHIGIKYEIENIQIEHNGSVFRVEATVVLPNTPSDFTLSTEQEEVLESKFDSFKSY